jgi:FixJ family two-component response regulator
VTGSVMSAETPIVFVVDDDRSVRDSLHRLIASVGMTVEVFPTAQACLSTSRRDAPGCRVLDVRLPGLSGLDLQRELGNTDATLPSILLTGHGDISVSVRAMSRVSGGARPDRRAPRDYPCREWSNPTKGRVDAFHPAN